MSKGGQIAFGIIRPGKALQAEADKEAAKKQVQNAEKMRQQGFDLTGKLNWQPQFSSNAVGPYQREQSPVARAYLESLLTGANPSSVQGTRLGSDRAKAAAQSAFDQQTGGWDALEAKQQALHSQTPWAVQSPAPVQELPDIRRNVHAMGVAAGQAFGTPSDHYVPIGHSLYGGSIDDELARRQAAGLSPQGLAHSQELYGNSVDAELARKRAAAGQGKAAPGWGAIGRQS